MGMEFPGDVGRRVEWVFMVDAPAVQRERGESGPAQHYYNVSSRLLPEVNNLAFCRSIHDLNR